MNDQSTEAKGTETPEPVTVYYGNDEGRLFMAQHIYEQFVADQQTDPDKAKTQLIASVQSALGQAFAQGIPEESHVAIARDIEDFEQEVKVDVAEIWDAFKTFVRARKSEIEVAKGTAVPQDGETAKTESGAENSGADAANNAEQQSGGDPASQADSSKTA